MQLYNTLSRKVEKFAPIKDRQVTMYACGPTVYSAPHIGNMRAYLNQDVLKRSLLHDGYKIKHVVNITDVGHLVGDANLGEDKVKLAAEREHKTARQVADFYTDAFISDIERLNVLKPDVMPRATMHVKEMLDLIGTLDGDGYLYTVPTGVYFDTSKFRNYGKLSGMDFERLNKYLKAGARVERASGLRNITDFAVWRFRKKASDDEMVWESKWGEGFPGWHIECSAMSMKYLGSTLDIHCGGIDHIPIHHTNEIAQSESATKEKFVNYWFHNNFLTVDGKKMAKSLGNVYTLNDIVAKGFSPMAFRYIIISAHYRTKLNFTLHALENVAITLKSIYSFLGRLSEANATKNPLGHEEFIESVEGARKKFFEEIEKDLNVPAALSAMHLLIKTANKRMESSGLSKSEARAVADAMLDFDSILGLNFEKHTGSKKGMDDEIKKLVEERETARMKKDFARADAIRNLLKEKYGVALEDTKAGIRWHREKPE